MSTNRISERISDPKSFITALRKNHPDVKAVDLEFIHEQAMPNEADAVVELIEALQGEGFEVTTRYGPIEAGVKVYSKILQKTGIVKKLAGDQEDKIAYINIEGENHIVKADDLVRVVEAQDQTVPVSDTSAVEFSEKLKLDPKKRFDEYSREKNLTPEQAEETKTKLREQGVFVTEGALYPEDYSADFYHWYSSKRDIPFDGSRKAFSQEESEERDRLVKEYESKEKRSSLKQARVVQKTNPKTDKKEWALVGTGGKALKYFGPNKPSAEAVKKEESRVKMFEHMKGSLKTAQEDTGIEGSQEAVDLANKMRDYFEYKSDPLYNDMVSFRMAIDSVPEEEGRQSLIDYFNKEASWPGITSDPWDYYTEYDDSLPKTESLFDESKELIETLHEDEFSEVGVEASLKTAQEEEEFEVVTPVGSEDRALARFDTWEEANAYINEQKGTSPTPLVIEKRESSLKRVAKKVSVTWDTSDDEDAVVDKWDLPSEVEIPIEIVRAYKEADNDPEIITDFLSDKFGFLVEGWAWKREGSLKQAYVPPDISSGVVQFLNPITKEYEFGPVRYYEGLEGEKRADAYSEELGRWVSPLEVNGQKVSNPQPAVAGLKEGAVANPDSYGNPLGDPEAAGSHSSFTGKNLDRYTTPGPPLSPRMVKDMKKKRKLDVHEEI